MEYTEAKPAVIFRYSGRFGHFLRAEASASALSYPLPPRTVLLGVLGAVLGLEKDTPQVVLKDALIAVAGQQPSTHWHYTKFRQTLPDALPMIVKAGAKDKDKITELPKRVWQEWLIKPNYQVTASLPQPHHDELVQRLKNRAWHYSPSLGLSEMMAELEFITEATAIPMRSEQVLHIYSVVPQDAVSVDGQAVLEHHLALQVIRMPREVTSDRVFSHANYLVERQGNPISVKTSQAWQLSGEGVDAQHVMFL